MHDEKNRDKIVNIHHRFVNTEYDSLSEEDLVKQLTVIWGAKESMYKTYPYGGLSFHDHIGIDPFDILFIDTQWFEESKDVVGGIAYPANKYGKVIYEAIPGRGDIVMTSSSMDT